jgi:hypothetical protein
LFEAAERGDSIAFVDAWHGPAATPEHVIASDLPRSVRTLISMTELRPGLVVQNSLVNDPEQRRDGSKRVFYLENQGVYEWATDGVGSDPVVWGRFVGTEPWHAEHEPLSRFLVQLVAFEAVIGATHGASAVGISLKDLERVLAPLRRLPMASWRWPVEPSWFFGGKDILAFVGPTSTTTKPLSDRFEFFVGARRPEGLTYLQQIENVDWARAPVRTI